MYTVQGDGYSRSRGGHRAENYVQEGGFSGRGGHQGGHRGGQRGGSTSGGLPPIQLKLNRKSLCIAWNNNMPCNGSPTTDGCKTKSGGYKFSWIDKGKFCGRDHRKRKHVP